MEKATRQQTKLHNRRLVLKTLYEEQTLSRADIARFTHLTRPTVSAIVAELIKEQFVVEAGMGPSAGGKRPMLLNMAHDAHQLLCLDLGSRTFRGALLNLNGDVVKRATFDRDERQGEDALALVYQLVEALRQEAEAPILGIGIGTPGLIDPAAGVIQQAVNLRWHDLPLRQLLSERYQLPVYIANDSHIAALAEYSYAADKVSDNLLLIKIGQGIASGIVMGGESYYGDGFGAGEIGHVYAADNGIICSCGNEGCLETTTSSRAILQNADRLAQMNPDSLLAVNRPPTWADIVAALSAGDPQALELVITAGHFLGTTLAYLIGTLNIHHVVIAGRVAQFGAPFLAAAQETACRRVLPTMAAATTVRYTTLGQDIVLLGSAAMILKHELGII